MKRNYFKEIFKDRKKIKIYLLCFLIALESITLLGTALVIHADPKQSPPSHSSSVGIIGGADGPTAVFISNGYGNGLLDWLIKSLNRKGLDIQIPQAGQKKNAATDEQRQDANERGLLILINKDKPVDKDYKPEDLSAIKYYATDRSEASRYMREEAADHFHQLVEAAALEGYKLVMTTAYRSYGFQQILWNNYVANEGEEAASRFSAKPGQSEHQSGLAVDVSSPSVDYALTESFGGTPEGEWLASKAHEFGFILRFPKGKEEITGYLYEPWHIRYVGKPVATEIYEEELTLEEYLELYPQTP